MQMAVAKEVEVGVVECAGMNVYASAGFAAYENEHATENELGYEHTKVLTEDAVG